MGTRSLRSILTTIGTLQGGLERLLLNDSAWVLVGFGLAFAGIGLAFLDAYVIPVPPPRPTPSPGTAPAPQTSSEKAIAWFRRVPRGLIVLAALVLFLGGIAVLVWKATESLSKNERPNITTTATMAADGSGSIEGHVTAFGVKSSDWIYVAVTGIPAKSASQTGSASNDQNGSGDDQANIGAPILYQTRAGPDRSGKVDLTFSIPVSFGSFQFVRVGATLADKVSDESIERCFRPSLEEDKHPKLAKEAIKQSCATVYSPQAPKRPTLSASWDGAGVLTVAVKTSELDPNDVVLLNVANARKVMKAKETRAVPKGVPLYRSVFSGSATGLVDTSVKVPVAAGITLVCVVATTIGSNDDTPLKNKELTQTRNCKPGALRLTKSSFALITLH